MGWNAKEAAMACGISPQSWREWELAGRHPRDYENVCKQIAARTECDLVWLMTGISQGPPPLPHDDPRQREGAVAGERGTRLQLVPSAGGGVAAEIDDDAMAYLRLAETLPCEESNLEPFGQRSKSHLRLVPFDCLSTERGGSRMDVVCCSVQTG
jgi:hypothetical protein